jgi:transcriptional regulator with XRE-family HTH domain
MRLDDHATPGERIAYYRKRQGMTQEVLCGLVGGRTTEWLRQIENNYAEVDKLSTIVAIADALQLPPIELLPGPFRTRSRRPGSSLGTAPDSVPAIESAMLRYDGMAGLIGVPTREPVPLPDLRGRVARAFFCSQTERWSEMGPLVPDMIADAWNLIHGAETEEQRREAYALQALVYRVASGMLDRLGETQLPWVAAERSMFAAEQTGDPLLIAGGAWRLAVVLRHIGRLREATDVPVAAADVLRSALTSPQAHSVYGSLMLKGAVGAATLGDRREAEQYFAEAARSAELIGDRNDYWFAFGPTNIAIHRVWLSLEESDPRRAIEEAEYVPHDRLPRELAERQASHLITVAWAHYLRRRDRDALDALKSARVAAPEQLIFTGRVHAMIRAMQRRERPSTKADLRELADFVGITGHRAERE